MSVPVSLEALRDRVAEFGARAYLVTVGGEGRAHMVSVIATVDASVVHLSAGATSRRNIDDRPAVSLLWPPAGDGEYSLIVDGEAAAGAGDGAIEVTPTGAVLHRVAGAPGDGPGCVPLLPAG